MIGPVVIKDYPQLCEKLLKCRFYFPTVCLWQSDFQPGKFFHLL